MKEFKLNLFNKVVLVFSFLSMREEQEYMTFMEEKEKNITPYYVG